MNLSILSMVGYTRSRAVVPGRMRGAHLLLEAPDRDLLSASRMGEGGCYVFETLLILVGLCSTQPG